MKKILSGLSTYNIIDFNQKEINSSINKFATVKIKRINSSWLFHPKGRTKNEWCINTIYSNRLEELFQQFQYIICLTSFKNPVDKIFEMGHNAPVV